MDTWVFVIVFSVLFYVFEIFPDFSNEIKIFETEAQRNCDMTKFTYLVHSRADTLGSWTGSLATTLCCLHCPVSV